jgi:MFS family permease
LFFSFPVSILIDRWSRKKAIGLMSILWSLATFVCIFTQNFRQLFIARTAIGVGEAGYAPGGTALIAALFPEKQRAKMLGLWNAAIPFGSALGIAIGGIIAERLGWRHAFGIVAVPGFVFALLFFRVKDYRTIDLVRTAGASASAQPARMSRRDIVREFVQKRSLLFNNLAFAANVFVTTSLLSWMPTYFHRVDGLAMGQAGTKSGLIMFMAIIGAPLGGVLADRWMRRRPNARMLFPALSSILAGSLLFVALTYFKGPVQYGLLLLVGVTIIMFVPAAVSVTQDVVHPGLRAISLSLNIIIQHTLGSTLGPVFVGAVSDAYGLTSALKWLPAFTLLAGILFWFGSRYYEKDSQSVPRVTVEIEDD